MKIHDLQSKIDVLKRTQEEIEKKRKIWVDRVKPLLIITLNNIANSYNIGWHVQDLNFFNNYEGVNITFGFKPSGIFQKTSTSARAFIKKGGTLTFAQSYNGDVFVIIMYPTIEDIIGGTENKIIGKFNIKDIDENFIIEKVGEFLDEMNKWEGSSEIRKLGFNIEPKSDNVEPIRNTVDN